MKKFNFWNVILKNFKQKRCSMELSTNVFSAGTSEDRQPQQDNNGHNIRNSHKSDDPRQFSAGRKLVDGFCGLGLSSCRLGDWWGDPNGVFCLKGKSKRSWGGEARAGSVVGHEISSVRDIRSRKCCRGLNRRGPTPVAALSGHRRGPPKLFHKITRRSNTSSYTTECSNPYTDHRSG